MQNIQFNKYRGFSFIVSAILVAIAGLLMIFKGFNFSIDFTGGAVIEFSSQGEEITEIQTRSLLKNLNIKDYSVQKTKEGIMIIKLGIKPSEASNFSFVINLIKNSLSANFPKTDINFLKIDFVSPQIGEELAFKAFMAVLISLIGVLFYVSVRFELKYSLGAILALIHDATLTLGFISLFSIPFDIATIAAILTVVGYSINDSVVIFDRIREMFKIHQKMEAKKIIELSLNSTLSRTIITSFTTLIAILAIILIGGEILRQFAVVIFFGIMVGTISSIFIAPCFVFQKQE